MGKIVTEEELDQLASGLTVGVLRLIAIGGGGSHQFEIPGLDFFHYSNINMLTSSALVKMGFNLENPVNEFHDFINKDESRSYRLLFSLIRPETSVLVSGKIKGIQFGLSTPADTSKRRSKPWYLDLEFYCTEGLVFHLLESIEPSPRKLPE